MDRHKSYSDLRVVLAAYDTPGIRALEGLFSTGVLPKNVRLLTHRYDDRNASLHKFAASHNVGISTAQARSSEAKQLVEDFEPDVLLSAYYRQRIPGDILSLARLGGVNLHPSLLPLYRGCFAVPWVIANGEQETGFTYHYMTEEFDEGPIILQERLTILPTDTAFSLFHRLIIEGTARLPEVVAQLSSGRVEARPQLGEGSYYTRQLPNDGFLDPSWSLEQAERFIRAMIFPPFRGAVLLHGGEEFEILNVENYLEIRRRLGLKEPSP